ncbi:MAG: FtsX-like permease family protein [Bacillota bacterium]
MNWLMIKNDFSRNKVINGVLLLFITFSAILASVSIMMGVQTFTSISELYSKAQPPHFLQMHKGDIDQDALDAFMSNHDDVVYWQSVEMLNVHGASIRIKHNDESYTLADNRLDIGLVKQNESRDLLLNANHDIVTMENGEIGIPILLKEQYDILMGDEVIIDINDESMTFVVTEFVLDAQMNSPMVSSTRILLSDDDFETFKAHGGETEYLIEAYFTSTKEASSFQTAYENADLPQDGQAVTYSMIFLLSAITDIIMVFVLLLVSMLLITVAFICVKFTIMAALEEEITEIGTMKAIGLPFKDIRNFYLLKYRLLAIVGVILGYIIALISSNIFTHHISITFGNVGLSLIAILLSLLVSGLVFLVITVYAKRVLKKIKNVTVVDSLVKGSGVTSKKANVKDGLHRSKKLSINWLMPLREITYKFKNWGIVFSVVILAVLMMLIPINLMNTFDSPEFVTYMGSSLEDILIEVDNGDSIETNYAIVVQVLENDDDIEYYYTTRRVRVQVMNKDTELMNLTIDTGDNAGKGLKYINGGAPLGDNAIAISYLNMNELDKAVGDIITLHFDGSEQDFVISGVYQDVTSGGFTAKSTHDFLNLESQKYTFSVDLVDSALANQKADAWSEVIGRGVSIDPMEDFIDQTLGGVVQQLKVVVSFIVMVGASLVVLITVLYLKLRLVKDYSDIAIMKAIGFSDKDLTIQYLIKIGVVALLGIITGVVLTALLGERIVNVVLRLSGIGLHRVGLVVNPWIQYLFIPLMVLGLILLATWIVLNAIKKYNIIAIINE